MERKVLYYSENCKHSRKVNVFIMQHIKPLVKELDLIDINDKRNPDPIPRFVDRIPMLVINHDGNQKILADQELRQWLLGLAKKFQGGGATRSDGRPPSDVGFPQPAGGARPETTDPRQASGNGLMEWSSSELLSSSGFSDSYSAFNPNDDESQYQSCSDKFSSINSASNVNKQLDNGDYHDYNEGNRKKEKEQKFQEDLAMKEFERQRTEPKRPNTSGATFDPEDFNKMWAEKNRQSQARM